MYPENAHRFVEIAPEEGKEDGEDCSQEEAPYALEVCGFEELAIECQPTPLDPVQFLRVFVDDAAHGLVVGCRVYVVKPCGSREVYLQPFYSLVSGPVEIQGVIGLGYVF